jgi:hypothetical protein
MAGANSERSSARSGVSTDNANGSSNFPKWARSMTLYLEVELASLHATREKLEADAEHEPRPLLRPTAEELRRACVRLRAWIERADGDDLLPLLEALQIRIAAETEQAELEGVLPIYAPTCLLVITKLSRSGFGLVALRLNCLREWLRSVTSLPCQIDSQAQQPVVGLAPVGRSLAGTGRLLACRRVYHH